MLDTYYEAFTLAATSSTDPEGFTDVVTTLEKHECVHMLHALAIYVAHRSERPEVQHTEAVEFVLRVAQL